MPCGSQVFFHLCYSALSRVRQPPCDRAAETRVAAEAVRADGRLAQQAQQAQARVVAVAAQIVS